MNQSEIDAMKSREGVYIVGRSDMPQFTQLVVSTMGALWTMRVNEKVSDRSYDFHEQTRVEAGPLTVQNQRDCNNMIDDLGERIAMLEHDIEFWKSMVARMVPLVDVCARLEHRPTTMECAANILAEIAAVISAKPKVAK